MIKQNCQTCPLRSKCWNRNAGPSNEALALNLLVCRMKLGVKRDKSAELILQMLTPKVRQIATFITSRCSVPQREELEMEIQSAIIEYLLTGYQLGERAWPLHYLFARPRGVMSGWAMRYIDKTNRRKRQQIHVGISPDVDVESLLDELNASVTNGMVHTRPSPMPTQEDEEGDDDVPEVSVKRVIEDGVTLSAREYRVFKFCLERGPGAHKTLSALMGVDRSTVSRIYRRAAWRVVASLWLVEHVLGVRVPGDARAHRRRILGLSAPEPRPEEVETLVAAAGAQVAARALGVNRRAVAKATS